MGHVQKRVVVETSMFGPVTLSNPGQLLCYTSVADMGCKQPMLFM